MIYGFNRERFPYLRCGYPVLNSDSFNYFFFHHVDLIYSAQSRIDRSIRQSRLGKERERKMYSFPKAVAEAEIEKGRRRR